MRSTLSLIEAFRGRRSTFIPYSKQPDFCFMPASIGVSLLLYEVHGRSEPLQKFSTEVFFRAQQETIFALKAQPIRYVAELSRSTEVFYRSFPLTTLHLRLYTCENTLAKIHSGKYNCENILATIHLRKYTCDYTLGKIHLGKYTCERTLAKLHLRKYSCENTLAKIHLRHCTCERTLAEVHLRNYTCKNTLANIHW